MAETLLTRTQRAAADFLERCLSAREPLAALSGTSGCGKTVTLNQVLDTREGSGARIIRINNFVAGPLTLHRVLAATLGVADAGELSPEQLEPMLRKALADDARLEPPIVAVDDAQSLLPETLRYLCLMAGLHEAGRPLFRILLVGRPGFIMREAIPSQFVLEPMRTDESRQFLTGQLARSGATLPEDVLLPIVQQGQGNLRKLTALLSARMASGERLPRRPSKPEPTKAPANGTAPAVGLPSKAGPTATVGLARFSVGILGPGSPARMVAAPAAIVAFAAVGVLLFRVAPSHKRDANHTPPALALARPETSTSKNDPMRVAGVAPTILPQGAAPSDPDRGNPNPGRHNSVAPVSVAAQPVPLPTAPVLPDPPPVTAASPAVPPAASVATPVATSPGQTTAPRPAARAMTRYRAYNISQCHHTMCPRWSVTDLSRQSRFVAAFDLNRLHLSPALSQHIREGTIDIIVQGAVSGPNGETRTLEADSLEATVAHHGRYLPAPTQNPVMPDASSPASSQGDPGAVQSPPPGFLSFPTPR